MGYKVKRGSNPTDNTIKDMVVGFIKRLIGVVLILALIVVVGYFLFQFMYGRFEPFREAADDVISWVSVFYKENGVWATLGVIVLVCVATWAVGEEAKKKERRKKAMEEMMK